MTAAALLLRPLGMGLARRVAMVLAALFVLVLVLAWLAVHMLMAVASAPAAGQALHAGGLPPASVMPPAATLAFHVAQQDSAVSGPVLDAGGRRLMQEWNAVLRARPDSRLILTLACPDTTPAASQQHIGAALVRLLAGDDLNPHRVQLALTGSDGTAMSPGDFRVTLELASP
ncbi:MAG: hypothetical protein KGI67_03450 [Pseudomonadota bacterium]|nr:hypothetical protein [Pseudomonadota bacterium]